MFRQIIVTMEIHANKLEDFYAALANANRIQIIIECSKKPLTVTEISRKINVSYSLTSTHVTRLARAGLVKKKKNSDNTVTITSLVEINEKGEIKRK